MNEKFTCISGKVKSINFWLLLMILVLLGTNIYQFLGTSVTEDTNEAQDATNLSNDQNEDLISMQRETIFSELTFSTSIYDDIDNVPTGKVKEINFPDEIWEAFSSEDFTLESKTPSPCGTGDCGDALEEYFTIKTNRGDTDILALLRETISLTNFQSTQNINGSLVFFDDNGVYLLDPQDRSAFSYEIDSQTPCFGKDILTSEGYVFVLFTKDILGIDTADHSFVAYNVINRPKTSYVSYNQYGKVEINDGKITLTPEVTEVNAYEESFTGYFACENTDPLWYLQKIAIDVETGENSYLPVI